MVSGVSGLVGGSVDEVAEILRPQTFAITASRRFVSSEATKKKK
jgi:hypothetical protein